MSTSGVAWTAGQDRNGTVYADTPLSRPAVNVTQPSGSWAVGECPPQPACAYRVLRRAVTRRPAGQPRITPDAPHHHAYQTHPLLLTWPGCREASRLEVDQ